MAPLLLDRVRLAGPRSRQRGVAMLLTLVIMSVLLLAGVVATGARLATLRGAGAGVSGNQAYYCAEAGLSAARDYLRQHTAQWNTLLANPSWQLAGAASLDNASLRYVVTITDDIDEFPPLASDPTVDRNGTILMIATCTDGTLATPTVLRRYLTITPVDTGGVIFNPGPATY